MDMVFARFPVRLPAPAGLVLGFALMGAGCTSGPPTNGFDDAVAAGERPVSMSGQGVFFGGKVGALITLSRGVGRGSKERKYRPPDPNDILNSEDDASSAMAYAVARGNLGSPMAPVTIHLKLQNHSQGDLKIEIVELNSDLGNFAVEPDTIILNAGETSEPNPMISQLGVTSNVLPFKVTLRLGQMSESQTILVKDVPSSAPSK
jgi:hypothetical protein